MKLQLTAYNKTYSVETEVDDYNIDEYFEMIIGLLFQAGFHKETIDRAIEDLSIAIKEE
jgi:3-methyladenine DNA glycosylase Tag